MLRLSRPNSLSEALTDTYEHLIGKLELLTGYPCTLSAWPADVEGRSYVDDEGYLTVALPSTDGPKSIFCGVRLPPGVVSDSYAKKVVGLFSSKCAGLIKGKKRWGNIRYALIQLEAFLWDDIAISLLHGGKGRWNSLELIQTVRDSLLHRYEGEDVSIGLIASRNWHELDEDDQKFRLINFKKPFDLRDRLSSDKAANLLADGNLALFSVDSAGSTTSLVVLTGDDESAVSDEWSFVPSDLQRLSGVLVGTDFALVSRGANELWLLSKSVVLKWTRNAWRRVSGPPLRQSIHGCADTELANWIQALVVHLSYSRVGALIAITDDPEKLIGSNRGRGHDLFGDAAVGSIDDLSTNFVARLASIDGAVVISSSGVIHDFGVILGVPDGFSGSGQGARTAATAYASKFGSAIKVSHDGPISVFVGGYPVREIG